MPTRICDSCNLCMTQHHKCMALDSHWYKTMSASVTSPIHTHSMLTTRDPYIPTFLYTSIPTYPIPQWSLPLPYHPCLQILNPPLSSPSLEQLSNLITLSPPKLDPIPYNAIKIDYFQQNHHFPLSSISCCTTPGSAIVLRSPNSSIWLLAIFRNTRRIILPLRVLGSSGAQ